MLDVGGLSLGLLKVMPLFKVVNAIGSSYFPERTINILVLNAPRVFQQLWAIVRAATPRAAAWRKRSRAPRALPQLQKLVDPRTQKKVHILSGGEHQLTGAQRACACAARAAQRHLTRVRRPTHSVAYLPGGCRHPGDAGRQAPAAFPERQ